MKDGQIISLRITRRGQSFRFAATLPTDDTSTEISARQNLSSVLDTTDLSDVLVEERVKDVLDGFLDALAPHLTITT